MRPSSLATTLVLAFALAPPAPARAATYYVAPDGDDDDAGDLSAPWATLQRAADAVAPGDDVVVLPGDYAGFYLETSGMAGAQIVFSARPGASITEENAETPDGINLEGASYVVVEGFTVNGMERAGLRAVSGEHVTFRGNRADGNGRWGILTGFVDDLLIEDNWTSGSIIEHGIYVGNSGDRPIIRRNVVWNNARNGIHINGDAEQGGDGIISEAIVEANTIYSNGADGGSGINCDGVQDSLFVNNLLYDSHASGISLYRIDGGGPSSGNLVINNTILVASDGRWALNIQDDSGDNEAFNNILFNAHPSRGAINLCGPGCAAGFESDYNLVHDRFTADDGAVMSLAEWRAATGQDAHSAATEPGLVFVDPARDDYQVALGGPAHDRGTSNSAPPADHDGNARDADAVDIGAFEHCGDDCVSAGGAPAAGGSPGAQPTGGIAGAAGATTVAGNSGRAGSGNTAVGGTGSAGAEAGASSGAPTQDDAGCSCKLAASPASRPALWVAAIALLWAARRAPRRSRRFHD